MAVDMAVDMAVAVAAAAAQRSAAWRGVAWRGKSNSQIRLRVEWPQPSACRGEFVNLAAAKPLSGHNDGHGHNHNHGHYHGEHST